MLGRPQKVDSPKSASEEEFDAGSDQEADGKVNMPVSRFQSKFISGNEDQKGGGKLQIGSGKDILDELLNLPEDRIFFAMENAP